MARKKIDLTGQRFGRLVVVGEERMNGRKKLVCKCDCGNEMSVREDSLKSGNTRSCGCLQKEHAIKAGKQNGKLSHYKDITGLKYSKLTTIRKTGSNKNKMMMWLCQCECGNLKEVSQNDLQSKGVQSCGCLHKDVTVNDLTNKKFGRLTVLGDSGVRKNNHNNVVWSCLCECGNVSNINSRDLISGSSQSCGCLQVDVARETLKDTSIKTDKWNRKESTKLTSLDQKLSSTNTSGYKGVTWDKSRKKWVSQITLQGRHMNLGRFSNKQDAINARKEAEDKYFKPILEKYDIKGE